MPKIKPKITSDEAIDDGVSQSEESSSSESESIEPSECSSIVVPVEPAGKNKSDSNKSLKNLLQLSFMARSPVRAATDSIIGTAEQTQELNRRHSTSSKLLDSPRGDQKAIVKTDSMKKFDVRDFGGRVASSEDHLVSPRLVTRKSFLVNSGARSRTASEPTEAIKSDNTPTPK